MNAETTLSSKGQVVIPKDIRDALDLKSGERLAIKRVGRCIVMEAIETQASRPRISYEEFRRLVPRHDGPPATIGAMNAAVDRMFAGRGRP